MYYLEREVFYMDEKTLKMIKDLEKKGFKIKKIVQSTKKTFEVPVDLLAQFMAIVKEKDLKVKDAFEEAMTEWVDSNS